MLIETTSRIRTRSNLADKRFLLHFNWQMQQAFRSSNGLVDPRPLSRDPGIADVTSPLRIVFTNGKIGPALAVLLAATVCAAAEMRTWNLNSGSTLEAEIVAFPDQESVTVKRSDGKVFTLSAAYLVPTDRAYLNAERAKQWKEVSVDKVLGPVASRYKKCAVSGSGVPGLILVAMLPARAEAVMNNRQQQEAQIADLDGRIQEDSTASHSANTAAKYGNRAYRRANKLQASLANQDAAQAKISLAKLKADYAEYVKKTKDATTELMKKTGVSYEGIPIWECQSSQKR
jgi:hypothetical protein